MIDPNIPNDWILKQALATALGDKMPSDDKLKEYARAELIERPQKSFGGKRGSDSFYAPDTIERLLKVASLLEVERNLDSVVFRLWQEGQEFSVGRIKVTFINLVVKRKARQGKGNIGADPDELDAVGIASDVLIEIKRKKAPMHKKFITAVAGSNEIALEIQEIVGRNQLGTSMPLGSQRMSDGRSIAEITYPRFLAMGRKLAGDRPEMSQDEYKNLLNNIGKSRTFSAQRLIDLLIDFDMFDFYVLNVLLQFAKRHWTALIEELSKIDRGFSEVLDEQVNPHSSPASAVWMLLLVVQIIDANECSLKDIWVELFMYITADLLVQSIGMPPQQR